MKNLLLSIVLVACLVAGANAHSGMLALFSDTENHDCHAALGIGQTGNLYLMYVRGDGPPMGKAYEFRLLKSTSQAAFLTPVWPTIVPPLGNLETGITLTSPGCFQDEAYVPLGTIPILNFADPDTFTVKVAEDPSAIPVPMVLITKCDNYNSIYYILGGTFVFNADCHAPEDPYGVLAVKETSWGAIKELYR